MSRLPVIGDEGLVGIIARVDVLRAIISDRAADYIFSRRHVERGLQSGVASGPAPFIGSNYFDLAMIMDYWSDKRLNHHTEATTMLYGARECARSQLDGKS